MTSFKEAEVYEYEAVKYDKFYHFAAMCQQFKHFSPNKNVKKQAFYISNWLDLILFITSYRVAFATRHVPLNNPCNKIRLSSALTETFRARLWVAKICLICAFSVVGKVSVVVVHDT